MHLSLQTDEPLDDEAIRLCRIAATAAVAVQDEAWKVAVVGLLADRDRQWREALDEYRVQVTGAESARAAQLALDVLQNALPGVIETVERSTRLSVVERDIDGFIAKVTTSTVADTV